MSLKVANFGSFPVATAFERGDGGGGVFVVP